MSNVYYDPEKFGLRTIAEVEFSSGYYEFDTLVLWQDTSSKAKFFAAQDSGCSCPTPFDSMGRDDLTPVNKLQDLLNVIESAKSECYRYTEYGSQYDRADIDGDCASMVAAYRKAKA